MYRKKGTSGDKSGSKEGMISDHLAASKPKYSNAFTEHYQGSMSEIKQDLICEVNEEFDAIEAQLTRACSGDVFEKAAVFFDKLMKICRETGKRQKVTAKKCKSGATIQRANLIATIKKQSLSFNEANVKGFQSSLRDIIDRSRHSCEIAMQPDPDYLAARQLPRIWELLRRSGPSALPIELQSLLSGTKSAVDSQKLQLFSLV